MSIPEVASPCTQGMLHPELWERPAPLARGTIWKSDSGGQRNGPALSRAPAHLPRCDDGTEGLQDIYGSKALLGVEDQQLPDETHGVLRHAPVPDAEQGEGSGGAGWAGSLQPTAPAQGVPLTQGWCTLRP